jgi:hypothetical protein
VARILDADRPGLVLAAMVDEAPADEGPVLRPRVEAVGGAVEADEALAVGDEIEERLPQRRGGGQVAAGEEHQRVVLREEGRGEGRRIGVPVDGKGAAAGSRDGLHRRGGVGARGMVVRPRTDVVEIQHAPLRGRRRREREAGEHGPGEDGGRAAGDRADAHAH